MARNDWTKARLQTSRENAKSCSSMPAIYYKLIWGAKDSLPPSLSTPVCIASLLEWLHLLQAAFLADVLQSWHLQHPGLSLQLRLRFHFTAWALRVSLEGLWPCHPLLNRKGPLQPWNKAPWALDSCMDPAPKSLGEAALFWGCGLVYSFSRVFALHCQIHCPCQWGDEALPSFLFLEQSLAVLGMIILSHTEAAFSPLT